MAHFYAQGLKNIFNNTFRQMNEAQILLVASSLAYTTILSIIPVLAVSFAIFHAFGGMQKVYDTIEPMILSHLAQGSGEEAIASLHQFIGNIHAGTVGIGGLVGIIFTTMTLLFSIEKAINLIWRAPITRGLFFRISTYWLFVTLGPVALAVAVGIATSTNFPLRQLLPSGAGLFLVSIGFFFTLYKWVPHREVRWPYALISATFTSTLWIIAKWGFTIYSRNVITYHKVYGSLAAIPIFLIWIYIVWVIVLAGAALTAALQGPKPSS